MAILTCPEKKAALKKKEDASPSSGTLVLSQDHQLLTTPIPPSAATRKNTWSFTNSNVKTMRERDICKGKLLGSGGFSNVFEAYHKKNTDEIFAIKVLKPSVRVNKKKLLQCASELLKEAIILANLDHENIITSRGIRQGNVSEFKKHGNFFLAMNALQKETLEDKMVNWIKKNKKWSLQQRIFMKSNSKKVEIMTRLQNIALGIVRGMEYLHSRHILHRDLKPANIGFDKMTGEIKIFDFGLARFIPSDRRTSSCSNKQNHSNFCLALDSDLHMTSRIGTPKYMAPEVVRGDTDYNFSVDVYSFAIILWQLVTDQIPFEGFSSTSMFYSKIIEEENLRPSLKNVSDHSLRDLIETCWSGNPDDRPSFAIIRQKLEELLKVNCKIEHNTKKKTKRKVNPFK